MPRLLPIAILILLPAILVLSGPGPGQCLYGQDAVQAFCQLRGAVGQELASGRLPVWDSHTRCGAPLLAGLHAGVLYPPTWLAAVLDPGAFWTLTAWLHLSLAGLFAYGWLRRGLGLSRLSALAGGLVYMLSGFMVTRIYAGHIPNISCYPWAAALMWGLERHLAEPTLRRELGLAAAFALMIFSGLPHFLLIAGLAVAARLVHYLVTEPGDLRASFFRVREVGIAFGIGLVLSGPQLLSTMELLRQIQRTSINTWEFVTSYSLPPENLLTFLVPTFFGDEAGVPYWGRWNLWELSGFAGISGLALAGLGAAGRHRQRYLWAGLAVLGILLALGSHTPLFRIFHAIIPGAALFRVPARYLMLTALALAPLAAFGVEQLRARENLKATTWTAGVLAVVMVALLGFGLSVSWPGFLEAQKLRDKDARDVDFPASADFPEAARRMATRGIWWGAACLALTAAALAASGRVRPERPWVAVGLVVLLGVELSTFGARYFTGYPKESLTWPRDFVDAVRAHPAAPFRIATVNTAQIDAFGKCQLAGIDTVGGYDPMMLRPYAELMNAARGEPVDQLLSQMHAARPGPVFDLLGARYWLLPVRENLPPGWRVAGQLGSGYVYENPGALPRVFLVNRSVVLPGRDERLAFLTSPSFRPAEVIVLEGGVAETLAGGVGAAKILERSPGLYKVDVDSAGPAFLVLTESHYPGWTVEIDGAPAELLRADHLLQAVRVPAGRHQVTFAYRSKNVSDGFVVALLALLIPVSAELWRRRRKPTSAAPPPVDPAPPGPRAT